MHVSQADGCKYLRFAWSRSLKIVPSPWRWVHDVVIDPSLPFPSQVHVSEGLSLTKGILLSTKIILSCLSIISVVLSQPLFVVSVMLFVLSFLTFSRLDCHATREASKMDKSFLCCLHQWSPQVKSHQQLCLPTKDSLTLWEQPKMNTLQKSSFDW